MDSARKRLAGARDALAAGHVDLAVSAAYYAMLYATRAALSERGEHAKTHGGTWTLFSRVFVAGGEFDRKLSGLAARAKEARERGDYDAAPPTDKEAAEYVDGAADFIAAIGQMLTA